MSHKEAVQTDIKPSHPDYAALPVEHGFEWPHIIRDFERDRGKNLRTGSTVLKVYSFRSILQPGIDPVEVGMSDDRSYEAIVNSRLSDHLYAYYRGERDANGEWVHKGEGGVNLSVCVWDDEQAAFLSLHGPNAAAHRESAGSAPRYYGPNWSLDIHSAVPHDEGVVFVEHDNPHALKHKKGTELYSRTIGLLALPAGMWK